MDPQIEKALKASLSEFTLESKEIADGFENEVWGAFNADKSFLEKVALLDNAFDNYPYFEEMREVFFDLLLMNFFSIDVGKLEEDYLESEEWERIEEKTLDRGTELLNLLLYLHECFQEGITPQLSDYLKEFLLVNDDEFQDEYHIYEPIIENQSLTDSTYSEIARVSSSIKKDLEIANIFYPIMSFFNDYEPTEELFLEYVKHSENKAFDSAVLGLLIAFNQDR